MTSVYGVTRYGARAQIGNQLRHNIDNFPLELVFDARAYLAEKTFECLHIMFTTNKAIQVGSIASFMLAYGGFACCHIYSVQISATNPYVFVKMYFLLIYRS